MCLHRKNEFPDGQQQQAISIYFFLEGLGFIEIVKGLGANNVLCESFGQFFFWNHILTLGLGAGLGWVEGLGWLGWAGKWAVWAGGGGWGPGLGGLDCWASAWIGGWAGLCWACCRLLGWAIGLGWAAGWMGKFINSKMESQGWGAGLWLGWAGWMGWQLKICK